MCFEDRHARERCVLHVERCRVHDVTCADDQHEVGLRELAVRVVDLDELGVVDVSFGEQSGRLPLRKVDGEWKVGILGARFLKTSERRRLHDRDDQFSTTGASYGAGSRTLPRPGELSTSSYGDSYIPASTQPGSAGLSNEPGFSTPPGTVPRMMSPRMIDLEAAAPT